MQNAFNFSCFFCVVDLRDVRPALQDLTHPELSLSRLP